MFNESSSTCDVSEQVSFRDPCKDYHRHPAAHSSALLASLSKAEPEREIISGAYFVIRLMVFLLVKSKPVLSRRNTST